MRRLTVPAIALASALCLTQPLFASPAFAATGDAPNVNLLSPVDGTDGGEEVYLAADAPEGTQVYYQISGGNEIGTTTLGPFSSAPFDAHFLAQPTDGNRLRVTAWTCDGGAKPGYNGCAGKSSGAMVAINRMDPEFIDSSAHAFSPNADGVKDTIAITYRLDTDSMVFLGVQDAEENLLGLAAISTTPQGAGQHTAAWDGRIISNTGPSGQTDALPDADYQIFMVTARDLEWSRQFGYSRTGTKVRIDRTAKATVSTDGAVFTVRDGYRDKARINVSAKEAGSFTAYVQSGGKTIRTLRGQTAESGGGSVSWDGRNTKRSVMKPGKYGVVVHFTDQNGNHAQAKGTVAVDGRHLVKKSATRTVNPSRTITETLENACNIVVPDFDNHRPGSLSIASEVGCRMIYQPNLAAVFNRIKLPAAPKYGSVSVTVNGSRIDKSGTMIMDLDDSSGYSSDGTVVRVTGGTTTTPTTPLSKLGTAPYVEWTTSVHNGAEFVIYSFKVSWTYYTLAR